MIKADVVLVFSCENDDCSNTDELCMDTGSLVSSGTPICPDCGDDAEYVGYLE